jgi:hypothetical protein
MSILSFDVGIKNLAYCVIDSETFEIVSWNVCEIPTDLEKQLAFLDECEFWKVPFQTVIIEKQPARNVKMRIVENTLNVYFQLKKVDKVSTYSSKHKLGALGKSTRGKTNYTLRKKYGVVMCKAFLKGSSYEPFFDKHKKKDDLADCLLQALAYAEFDMAPLQTSIVQL